MDGHGHVLKKVDYILKSSTNDASHLLQIINQYYNTARKKNIEIIEFDFKKREIVAFWEILKNDLGEGF